MAVLTVAVMNDFGRGQHQRERVVARTVRRDGRLDELRQRVFACLAKSFREKLDLACWCFESLLAIAKIVRLASNADAAGLRAQIIQRQSERCDDRIEPGVDVAIPKQIAKTETLGEFEHDIAVGGGFAGAGNDRLAQLDGIFRGLTTVKSDPQGF